MSLSLLGFLTAVALAYVVPGPDFAVILRYASRGRREGRSAAFGVLGGLCIHLSAAILGVSALLAESAAGFTVVKLAGAGYLLFLGIQSLWGSRKSGNDAHAVVEQCEARSISGRRAFVQGFLTNVLNPKAALFFLSLLPQFVDHSMPALPQTVMLGLLTVGFGLAWWMAFVSLADRVRGLLSRPKVRRALDRITGLMLVGLGIGLLRTSSTSSAT
jgi:threonine/homoserine/homoserine lactone efflux protein